MSPKSLLVTNILLAQILNMQDYSWRFYLKMQANHQNLQWFRSNTFKTLIMAKRFLMKIQKTAKGFCCDFFGPLVPFILCRSHSGVPMTRKELAHVATNGSDLLNCCPTWCFWKHHQDTLRESIDNAVHFSRRHSLNSCTDFNLYLSRKFLNCCHWHQVQWLDSLKQISFPILL